MIIADATLDNMSTRELIELRKNPSNSLHLVSSINDVLMTRVYNCRDVGCDCDA